MVAEALPSLETRLEAAARAQGFVAFGIAAADAAPQTAARLRQWLADGHHGGMIWMESRAEQRGSPRGLWPAVRSVVALGMSYAPALDPLALADQPDRPRERVGPGPGDTGVHQGVQHLALRLPQPGHHRHCDVGEQDSLRLALADRGYLDAPGDLAAIACLGLVGDTHPFRARLLTEPRRPARRPGLALGALGIRQPADHGDLFAVDDDLGVAVEPLFGESAAEPVGGVCRIGLVGLLPAAGAARPSAVGMMMSHDYMLTPLQPCWMRVHHRRNSS